MKALEKILNKIFICYTRNDFFKGANNKLGKCVIEEDRIVCKINNKKLRKKFNKSPFYHFDLNGILINENNKQLCRLCNIDKMIYYVIENMDFDKAIQFSSRGNCQVLFKNCTFNKEISIYYGNDIIFSNNKYYDYEGHYFCGHSFFNVISMVKSLKIINDNLFNSIDDNEQSVLPLPKFGLNIKAKNLEIINSNIKSNKPGDISIYTNNLVIDSSTISSNQIFIDACNIDYKSSLIESSEGIIIDNENNNNLYNIFSKTIIYNGVEIQKGEEEIPNKKQEEKSEIRNRYLKLLQHLKNIGNYYNIYSDYLIGDYKTDVEKRKIKRLVK